MDDGLRSYLQVPLGGERLLAHGAPEGLVPGVRPHVDLEGGTGAKVLAAARAQVLRVLHSRSVVLHCGLLLLAGLFPGLFLSFLHLLRTLEFALQGQQS